MNFLLLCFSLVTICADRFDYVYGNLKPWIYHEFDNMMEIKDFPKAFAYTNQILNYDGRAFYDLGKDLYDRHNPSILKPQATLIIPKIIHQIWIGSDVPECFDVLCQTWKDMHPDWEYNLWTDERVKDELFPLYNQAYYDESESMGVKSDLLKWEIVYRFGGVYVDMDFECLKPLDLLHYTYDFYTGYQPLDAFFVQLGAALYAAYPNHPILKHCIETIKDDWHHQGAPKKSGPCHFSKSFMATAGKNGSKDIAFPAYYFYPLPSTKTELKYNEWVQNGAYAIHHWAKSWMPVSYRPKQFRTFDNKRSSDVWND